MSQSAPEESGDMIDRLMRQDSSQKQRVTQPRSAPQREWVCGFSELGQGCSTGPDNHGRCGRCHQNQRGLNATSGDASSESIETPPLCIPRRTTAWQRQALRINLAILTAGALLLCMLLPSREQSFVPGELSAGHAQIMATTLVSQRCGLCHPASHIAPKTLTETPKETHSIDLSDVKDSDKVRSQASQQFWVSVLSDTARRMIANDGRQDALCMQCHKAHMPRASDRNPHDLSREQWQLLVAARKQSAVGQTFVGSRTDDREASSIANDSNGGKTSCAMCHNEHHGRGFDIKLIADDRCQACHSRRFESLAAGHPEFVNYPAQRERALAFSHASHADKHFSKKNREFDCRACHIDAQHITAVGGITRSVSFETACASCHNEPIRAATVDGWAVLQLPSLDQRTVAANREFEKWPQAARFGFEGQISPVLRALLLGDDAAIEALQSIPASGMIAEVPGIDGQRERVTLSLALATQRLLSETASLGQVAWRTRLEKVTRVKLRRELSDYDRGLIATMCRGVSPDLFRRAEQEWFGEQVKLVDASTNSVPAVSLPSQAAPRGGRLVTSPDKPSPPESKSALVRDDLLAGQDLLSSGDDLLSGNSAQESDALLDASRGDVSSGNIGAGTISPKTRPIIKGATHLSAGGWYLDDQTLAVRYMPTGHADETLSAWCYWWSLIEHSENSRDAGATTGPATTGPATVSQKLSGDSMTTRIPGGCAECHLLKDSGSMTKTFLGRTDEPFSLPVLWRVPQRSALQKEFTKFNHSPHLQLPVVNDCRYCHKLDATLTATSATDVHANVSAQHSASPYHRGSEFATMTVSQCTACHRPGGASDRCTQCHNYHVSDSITIGTNDRN